MLNLKKYFTLATLATTASTPALAHDSSVFHLHGFDGASLMIGVAVSITIAVGANFIIKRNK